MFPRQEGRQTTHRTIDRFVIFERLDEDGQQEVGWNRHGRFESVGALEARLEVLRQARECRVDILGRGDAVGIFGIVPTLPQGEWCQVTSQREKVSGVHVFKAKITDTDGSLGEFGAFQGQFDAVVGAIVAKDVSTESAMMPTETHGEFLVTMGAGGTEGIGDPVDGKVDKGKSVGKVLLSVGKVVRYGLTVKGNFILIRAALLGAIGCLCRTIIARSGWGCHGGSQVRVAGGRGFFLFGSRPRGNLAFVIYVKGFSGSRIVHDFPVSGQGVIVIIVIHQGRRRKTLLDPVVGRFPLCLARNVVGVKDTTRFGVGRLDPSLQSGWVGRGHGGKGCFKA